MVLVVYWYDFICFGIVAAATAASLWVLWWKKESNLTVNSSVYHRLVTGRPESDVGFVEIRRPVHVGSSRLWTSCWRGVQPGWLLLTRSVSFLAMSLLLSWDIVKWEVTIFVYYTEWTFVLVMLYFALGIVASAYGSWKHSDEPIGEGRTTILPSARFWVQLMEIIYQTCAGAVILTDLVFWCVIVPFLSNTHLGLNLLMILMHTTNTILLLLDTSLNSLPFPWFRIAYFVQWSCLYVVFQWILQGCGFTWWPYPFLKLGSPWAPIWYLLMAIFHIPCYGAYFLIVKAKNSILSKFFPNAFVKPNY